MGTSFLQLLRTTKHQQCLGKQVQRDQMTRETTILHIVTGRTPTLITIRVDKRPVVISMMVQDILSTEVPIKGTAETTVSTKIPVAKEPILLLPRILPPKNRRWVRTAAYVICCVKMPSIPKYFTYSPAIRPEQHFFLY